MEIHTPITAFYAGLISAFYVYLSLVVVKERRSRKIGLGDGDDKHLRQVIRAHGNFAEYVPLALVLFLVAEINGTRDTILHVCGLALLFGRMLQAYGLRHHYGASWQRVSGTALTFVTLSALSMACLQILY